jgi:polar amino acid transport system substrate-binding protein
MFCIRLARTSSLLALLVAACAVSPADPGDAVRRALAPTGKLRVGLISVPVHSIKDPYSGELRGVSHDLGRELAARMRVPFEPIVYPNPTAYVAAGEAGQWDIGSLGVTPERQALFDLAQPHLDVDYGYLVPADTRITSISEADRPGVRVAVVERSASDFTCQPKIEMSPFLQDRDVPFWVRLGVVGC